MCQKESQISEKIRNQVTTFNNWKNTLKDELQKKLVKPQNVYIISKEWIEEYQKAIFQSENNNNEELIKSYENFKLIDNDLPYVSSLRDLKSIFPLNEESWKSFVKDEAKEKPNMYQGEYGYNILILEISKEERIHCFFFLDQNNELKQGYIQIYRTNLEKKMIEELKHDTPLEFFKKYNIKYDNEGLQLFSYFEVIIFNLEKTEKNDTKQIEINHEEIMSAIKNNIDGIIKEIEAGRMTNVEITNKLGLDAPTIKNDDLKLKIANTSAIFMDKQKQQNIKKKDKSKKMEKYKTADLSQKEIEVETQKENRKDEFGKKIKGFFSLKSKVSPGIKGLKNVGATCYMNATLQCFSNINKIRTELINKYLKAKDKELSSALAEVLYNLWEKLDERKFSPNNFKEIISRLNPMFKGIGANDPKDLILFMLMTIHKETNEKSQMNLYDNAQPPNQFDFMAVYNDFINYCSNQNNSIISNEFYGYTDNMTTCAFCTRTIHNIQLVNILFFPLEEVRKFKGYYEGIRVPLLSCFEYYEKYEMYPSFYCNNCNFCYPAYSNSKLIKAPKSLIINLNRGKGLEFNVNVSFEEYLDIKLFICSYDSPYYYELKGVISHFGTNDDGGHFIAYCKNSNNCKWYKYNDEIVEECNFEDVVTKGMPYVLFYSHIEVGDDQNELQQELENELYL